MTYQEAAARSPGPHLARRLGFLGLAATGICSMIGAGINVVPIMIQRNVPGIGPFVLPAFLAAAVPALLAALVYAMLASAMPRAGGSYLYASRSLSPYLGFAASFSQWFGLSIASGVVAYLVPTFLRDIAIPLGQTGVGLFLDGGAARVVVPLLLYWAFVVVNLRGITAYERVLIPLMILMFLLGTIVIVAGFSFDQTEFVAAVQANDGPEFAPRQAQFHLSTFLAAVAVLFSSFIGFDSIAQAGGEARSPGRNMPRAILLAVGTVTVFYLLFVAAVYHAVPWSFVAQVAMTSDVNAPGLLGYLLPPTWTVLIVAGAAIALLNDLPAMLFAVSRLVFAWSEDGVFPRGLARIHPRWRTPHRAILISAAVATVGILGSHLAGDFFLGVDLMVLAMLFNFFLMCLSVLWLPRRNPELARRITLLRPPVRQLVAAAGAVLLGLLFVVQVTKDLASPAVWYFKSTLWWLITMMLASVIYLFETKHQRSLGVDFRQRFLELPPE